MFTSTDELIQGQMILFEQYAVIASLQAKYRLTQYRFVFSITSTLYV